MKPWAIRLLLALGLMVPLGMMSEAMAQETGSITGRVTSDTGQPLAGVAVSSFLAAVTAFVTYASPDPNKLRAVLFWLLGSLAGARSTRSAIRSTRVARFTL